MTALRSVAVRDLRAALGNADAERALALLAPTIASLPATPDAPADADLARVHESAIAPATRRAQGIHYTPSPLVNLLLADIPGPVDRLIDPSCGGGAFLLGALRSRRIAGATACFGADTDSVAVEIARVSLFIESGADTALIDTLNRNLRCTESLMHNWGALEESFDAVVGNPPFVDSESMSRESPTLRAAVRERYASARGNWDLSVPFVELALRLARPGGTVALVIPRRVLGSDYAAALHQELLRHEIVSVRDLALADLFADAGDSIALLTIRKRPAPKSHRVQFRSLSASLHERSRALYPQSRLGHLPRGHLLAPLDAGASPLLTRFASLLRLRDVATVSDGATTAEAYLIRDALREASDDDLLNPRHIRLVNTGTVDPFAVLWGERPTTYLKRRLLRPVIDREALSRTAPRRLAQAEAPKVVVAGLCRRIEAVALPAGWLCAKSAVLVQPHDGVCPHALAALLNAPSTTALHRAVFSGRSLGRGALHVAPRQLEQLPVPDRALLAPGSELSELGRSSPAPSPEDLDRAVSACFEPAPAGTIRAP